MPRAPEPESASARIDARIAELADWRADVLARIRRLVHRADPDVVEEWKWRGVPVWSHDGIICTGETYRHAVKVTFAKGASLEDPARLFNASLEGNVRRAIDLHEGDKIDERAFVALVRAAVALNTSSRRTRAAKPKLLAGGNPQVARAAGDAPVQAYIRAMPGWKRDVGRRLDALVVRTVPDVRKAVKWNSPFYGIEGTGWFLSFHTFAKAVKVTFFNGTSLRPVPPGGAGKDARWVDVHEHDLDEAQLAAWIEQAAARPGWLTADIRA
jgi:hypothetical protein